MRLFNDNQRQKHATALLCVLLLAVMTFSSVFILLEHDHDCSGADRPVCLAIHQAKKNMTCLGLGEGNMTASLPSQAPSFQQHRFYAAVSAAVPATLVFLKVRQNK
jgi:hypothetical protein